MRAGPNKIFILFHMTHIYFSCNLLYLHCTININGPWPFMSFLRLLRPLSESDIWPGLFNMSAFAEVVSVSASEITLELALATNTLEYGGTVNDIY